MAFTVAALCADGESAMHGAEAASVSFPEFFEKIGQAVSLIHT
jgi:3-phosphoshikimate 1-carboxyvinyltransferase